MRAPVAVVRVAAPDDQLAVVDSIGRDLRAAGNVADLVLEPASELQVEVSLST